MDTELVMEARHQMDRVVDRDPERDRRNRHLVVFEREIESAHRAHCEQNRGEVRHHRDQANPEGAEDRDHHQGDHDEGDREALDLTRHDVVHQHEPERADSGERERVRFERLFLEIGVELRD